MTDGTGARGEMGTAKAAGTAGTMGAADVTNTTGAADVTNTTGAADAADMTAVTDVSGTAGAGGSGNPDPWAPLEVNPGESEKIWGVGSSFISDVWYRFTHKPTALFGLALLVALSAFCLIGPYLTGHRFDLQNLSYVSLPPVLNVIGADGKYVLLTQNLKLIEVTADGELMSPLVRVAEDAMNKRETFEFSGGGRIVLNYMVKPARLEDEQGNVYGAARRVRNKRYILGSDGLGRDLLTRMMMGMRISLLIALIAAGVNLVIGIMYGGVSGYFGGTADALMMRVVDIISTIPLTLYVILIQVLMGASNGIASIVIALGTVYWVNMARVVRGEVLTLKDQEFVHAALTLGSSPGRIIRTHILPNAMGPIIVTVTMYIPTAIFIEAFMSFIGLGVMPPAASLGTMCNDALTTLRSSPYQLFFPSAAICLIMFAFNFIGDGLRDALDPKLRR